MENELVEDDFDAAVVVGLYLCERRRDESDIKAQANRVGFEVARILAPLWGGEVGEAETETGERGKHEHTFIDGKCTSELCGLRQQDGVTFYGELPIECDEHKVVKCGDGQRCIKCGGREVMPGVVTVPAPRIMSCEHRKFKPLPDGSLRCLYCGQTGN
ncbi:MAG: hypothetical protein M3444_07370 [Acidobacteriota bacterium]|nr:hypothetical protein [Acidobacteriota bacterium]MDQ5835444.1 hypothetical protein [Acidobacteriota bacterium]